MRSSLDHHPHYAPRAILSPVARVGRGRAALATIALAGALLVALTSGRAGAAGSGQVGRQVAPAAPGRHRMSPAAPGRRQVALAVARAERSGNLWATVNICAAGRFGVRGQMPTLGFPASLSMRIRVEYWSSARRRFIPIPSATATATLGLGRHATGLQQAGEVFPFSVRTRALLDATITFTWTRDGRPLGSAVRRTTAGHRDAGYGSPPGYSAAQCSVG